MATITSCRHQTVKNWEMHNRAKSGELRRGLMSISKPATGEKRPGDVLAGLVWRVTGDWAG